MNKLLKILGFLGMGVLALAQTTTPSTTLCANVTATATSICLTSTTNVVNQTGLYVDLEYMTVNLTSTQTLPATNAYVPVTRANRAGGAPPSAHNNAQTVWIALTPDKAVVPGSNGFEYSTQFGDYGPCTRSSITYLPHIWPDRGVITDCNASTGLWTQYMQEKTMQIGPGSCAWSTTGTTTGTNGLTTVGASAVPVNQVQVSNAGASVNTLQCWLTGDVYQALLNKGATITGYNTFYGVQTTALTSINGAAVGTVTFPAPAANETASTVTPVSACGTLTTSSTTGNLATVTAGAFRTIGVTCGTPLNLSTQYNGILFTLVFNQSAAAADIVNSPGMQVIYTEQFQ